ncbi:MAG: protoporphyrinogen oxidase [Rhodothermales bacterium]|nr:protoporphyrinogen oxidase [Rhodothermales bacterium]
MPIIAILGGGIAGLTAALRLRAGGADAVVFEAAAEPGGALRSKRTGGFLVEYGPNTLRARTPLLHEVIAAVGLEDEVVEARAAARHRYVVRGGVPVPLPASPPGLLRSDVLSWRGRLRLLAEPFVGRGDEDETVAAFVRRRLGREALAYGADPFVAGIFAGDPGQLSMRHAFPALVELEQKHGSLLKGLVRQGRSRESGSPAAPGIFSFRDGLQQLPVAMAHVLGDAVSLSAPVTALRREGGGWRVEVDGVRTAARFDAAVSTLPLHALSRLELPFDAGPLADVVYAPVAVVALGFRRADVAHPLDGFGVLVPAAEADYRILGAIFSSTLFPGRAPDDHVLLTVLAGGMRHPDLAALPADVLADLTLDDLRRLLGVTGAPAFIHHYAWRHGIPQYTPGYDAVLRHLGALEAAHPGLYFAGNYRDGVSVPDAMASGEAAAQRLRDALSGEEPG